MVKGLNIPPDIESVTNDGSTYYNLRQLMEFFEVTFQGVPRMKKYRLRLIYIDNHRKGPNAAFVLEDDIKNIVYRHRKLADRYLIGV